MKIQKCSVDGCDKSAAHSDRGRSGMCSMHYQRYKKHGDPLVVLHQKTPALDWIENNVHSKSDDCIIWPFATGEDGYGRIHNPMGRNTMTTASRFMCISAHGIPSSPTLEAAHKCGNGSKGCVNPNHLYWATPAKNQSDRVLHGTTNRGTRQWQSKLKEHDVIEIRKMLLTATGTSIAKFYSVDQSIISDIKCGKSWGWLE